MYLPGLQLSIWNAQSVFRFSYSVNYFGLRMNEQTHPNLSLYRGLAELFTDQTDKIHSKLLLHPDNRAGC